DLPPSRVHRRVVVAGMAAAALPPQQCRLGYAFADEQHVAQIKRQVPARIEPPGSLDAQLLRASLELVQLGERLAHLLVLTDDADEIVHRLLEFLMQR